MQPVRQLDHNDPDILGHGQEHLAVVLQLHFFLGLVLDAAQLGDPVNEHGNFFAKHFLHLLISVDGVLYHIMKQGCTDGLIVEMKFGKYLGHMERMDNIRLT